MKFDQRWYKQEKRNQAFHQRREEKIDENLIIYSKTFLACLGGWIYWMHQERKCKEPERYHDDVSNSHERKAEQGVNSFWYFSHQFTQILGYTCTEPEAPGDILIWRYLLSDFDSFISSSISRSLSRTIPHAFPFLSIHLRARNLLHLKSIFSTCVCQFMLWMYLSFYVLRVDRRVLTMYKGLGDNAFLTQKQMIQWR